MQQMVQSEMMKAMAWGNKPIGGGWNENQWNATHWQRGAPAQRQQAGITCGRCNGNHLASQCAVRISGKPCQRCFKPGHTERCCRSKHDIADVECKCCGDKGHAKKDCPYNSDPCDRCHIKGHTINMCRYPVGYSPPVKKDAAKQQGQGQAPTRNAAPDPPRKAWNKDGTAAAAPEAIPDGESSWTYLCRWCSGGIKDAARTAAVCPHPKCKETNPRKQQEAKTETPDHPSVMKQTFTKKAIETEQRVETANPDGTLPLTKQDQENIDKAKDLEEAISKLKGIGDPDLQQYIDKKEQELKALKNKLPDQGAQQLRDGSDMLRTLAEIKEKGGKEEAQLKERLDKIIQKRIQIVQDGEKRKKDIQEEMADKLKQTDENVRTRQEQAEKEEADIRKEMEILEKELKGRESSIQAKAGPLLTNTTPPSNTPASSAAGVMMEVAPGSLLHSSQVSIPQFENYLLQRGIGQDHTAGMAQILMDLLNHVGTKVEAPIAKESSASTAGASHGGTGQQQEAGLQNDLTLARGVEMQMPDADDLTDADTDSDDETKDANGEQRKKKVKITKQEKKSKGKEKKDRVKQTIGKTTSINAEAAATQK